MNSWWRDAVFYHIYPLGFCGAEPRNDFQSAPVPRLELVSDHIPHMKELGCNALYLGPLFESSAHGYDTADYFKVDRRLGAEDTLRHLVDDCHRAGIRVVLDGVFNHVGREYWAFRDLREDGAASAYTDWFKDIDFGSDSPSQDGFAYQGWEGDHSLVSLNHDNPAVRQHLIQAALWMVETFGIDGLRLDVAYMLDKEFLRELAAACRSREADFWLLGEIIHGDYRSIA
jgi:glycosidase